MNAPLASPSELLDDMSGREARDAHMLVAVTGRDPIPRQPMRRVGRDERERVEHRDVPEDGLRLRQVLRFDVRWDSWCIEWEAVALQGFNVSA